MITLQKARLYWTPLSCVKYYCFFLAIISRLSCPSNKEDLWVEEYCICRTLTVFRLAYFGMSEPSHNYVHEEIEVDLIRERLATVNYRILNLSIHQPGM